MIIETAIMMTTITITTIHIHEKSHALVHGFYSISHKGSRNLISP